MNKFKYICYKLLLIDLWKRIWLILKQFFSCKKTLDYPAFTTARSLRFKGVPALLRYSNGNERCIGCKLCSAACPALAINIGSTIEVEGSRSASSYEIDLFKCIYCGLCEESCPVGAIVQTNIEDYHFESRGQQILTKEKLLAIGDQYGAKIIESKNYDAIIN